MNINIEQTIHIGVAGTTAYLAGEACDFPSGTAGIFKAQFNMSNGAPATAEVSHAACFYVTPEMRPDITSKKRPIYSVPVKSEDYINGLHGAFTVTMPPELFLHPGETIYAGLNALNQDGTIIYTSTLCRIGMVEAGADPGLATPSEGSPLWAAVTEASAALEAVNEKLKAQGVDILELREKARLLQEGLAALGENKGLYTDVTEPYAGALASRPGLEPREFLAEQGDGAYYLDDTDGLAIIYYARNTTVAKCRHSEIIEYTDDGYVYRYLYVNGNLTESWDSYLGANGAVSVSAHQIAENTSRIAELSESVRKTVTDAYAQWLNTHSGTPLDYVKTLQDGDYRIVADLGEYLYHKFTAGNNVWIAEAQYPNDSVAYVSFWCNDSCAMHFSNDDGIFLHDFRTQIATTENIEQVKREISDKEQTIQVTTGPSASVRVDDSARRELRGLTIYGRTIQDGTPTPENPVELVSAGAGGSITATVTDGGSSSQTLSLATPNGLPGIPVDSGGNYTDENGQQWICDEIDLGRGKHVQRVHTLILNGTERFAKTSISGETFQGFAMSSQAVNAAAIKVRMFSNTFQYSADEMVVNSCRQDNSSYGIRFTVSTDIAPNKSVDEFKSYIESQYELGKPVVIQYVLESPVETDVPAEELAAYRKLHTYCPVSTVTNSAGTQMQLTYIADPKRYIDGKFAKLQAQLAQTQAQML